MTHEFPIEHFFKSNNPKVNGINTSQNTVKSDNKETLKPSPTTSGSNDLTSLENALKGALKTTLNDYQYTTYIADGLSLKSFEQKLIFHAKTNFIMDTLRNSLNDHIKFAIYEVLGKDYPFEITCEVKGSPNPTPPALNRPKSAKEMKFSLDLNTTHEDKNSEIESNYLKHMDSSTKSNTISANKNFKNFIVGASNNMAYNAALAVAESPGRKYPSLYIHSSSGLGKTHLLSAVANGIREKYPHLRICYISAREFMKEMIYHMRENTIGDFQKKYSEKIDVLMIDDIHELGGKTGTQNELFHVFNELYNREKQLIFTSDKTPQEISGIEERIKTRLSWGLVVDIQKPDLETRIAILQENAKQLDLYLTDDILTLIASSIKTSIRELEGSIIALSAYTDLMKSDIDAETVKKILKIQDSDHATKLNIEDIAKASAQYFKIPLADLKSKSRSKDIAKARHIAMYLSRKLIHATQQEIGHFFGGRDHSTVISGVRKVEEQLKTDSILSRDIFEVENRL